MNGKRITTHIHNLSITTWPNVTVVSRSPERAGVRGWVNQQSPRQSQQKVYNGVQGPLDRIRESCDSWEPYKALIYVDKLHIYLRNNAMRTLIPKEHKQHVRRIFFKIFNESTRFSAMVFSGWNPTYLRTTIGVRSTSRYIIYTLYNSRVYTKWGLVNQPSKRRGYCDTAVRTGTSGTGQALRYWLSTHTVRTCTVCTPGQPVTQPPGSLRLSYLAVSLIHLW